MHRHSTSMLGAFGQGSCTFRHMPLLALPVQLLRESSTALRSQRAAARLRHMPVAAEQTGKTATAEVAPVIAVTLVDGTTVTLVDPKPPQLKYQDRFLMGTTWPQLLGALALATAALVAAAAACFMLYIRPILKAMSVALAEMEIAAKKLQQASQQVELTSELLQSNLPQTIAAVEGAALEVQQLTGSINSAARLLTPTHLLKQLPSSSTANGDASSSSSSSAPRLGQAGSSQEQKQGSLGTPLLEQFKTDFKPLQQTLQLPTSLTEICMPGSSSSAASNSSSSNASGTLWDAISLGLSANTSRRSLARLREDLAVAAEVVSLLLTPANKRRYERLREAAAVAAAARTEAAAAGPGATGTGPAVAASPADPAEAREDTQSLKQARQQQQQQPQTPQPMQQQVQSAQLCSQDLQATQQAEAQQNLASETVPNKEAAVPATSAPTQPVAGLQAQGSGATCSGNSNNGSSATDSLAIAATASPDEPIEQELNTTASNSPADAASTDDSSSSSSGGDDSGNSTGAAAAAADAAQAPKRSSGRRRRASGSGRQVSAPSSPSKHER